MTDRIIRPIAYVSLMLWVAVLIGFLAPAPLATTRPALIGYVIAIVVVYELVMEFVLYVFRVFADEREGVSS